jgi:hypothetical protein
MDVSDARKLKVLEAENDKLKRLVAEQLLAIDALMEFSRGLSTRVACRLLGMSRRIACYRLRQPPKDKAIGERLVAMTQQYPRFGYRRAAIWVSLGETCLRRLWRNMRLQLPRRRPRRRRTGSDIRLPGATMAGSIWTYDFLFDRLASGTTLKMLCVLDEHTRECLVIEVGRWMRLQDVILTLSRMMKL